MTDLLDNNGEAILLEKTYPPEWEMWLKIPYGGALFTNREILEDPTCDILGGWYNPFTRPDLLDRERQESDMKPYHWRQYVLDNYPGIDATEQFRKRKVEVGDKYRLERMKKCRKVVTVIDPATGEAKKKRLPPCNQYDICPDCAAHKIENEQRILKDLMGSARVVIVLKKDEKKVARQIDSDYRRYPIDNNQTAFVVKTDDENVGKLLTYEKCMKLGNCAISSSNRRVTGKLGQEEDVESDEDEVEKVTIHRRRMDIEYDSDNDNAPRNLKQLQDIVERESEITENPDKDTLQWAVYELEEKFKNVCEQYGMSFNFVDVEYVSIDINKIMWKWTLNKQKPA